MARAKRTSSERAAARRRYRAATDLESAEEVAEGSTRSPATEPARSAADAPRMGIMAALRASFRPLNIRGDLAALPSLVPHKALWVPVLVTIATAIATTVSGGSDVVTPLLFTYFIVTPAVGGVFLAGFLAPKASWLLGVLVSLVAAVSYIAMGVAARLPEPFQTQFDAQSEAIIYTLVWSPLLGAFFASAAAWYRRFLTLSNPNRGRRQQQAQKRATDGRSRGSNNAKAAARR